MYKGALFFFLGCFSLFGQTDKIAEEWKNDKALLSSAYGFSVIDIKTKQILAELNSHQGFVPASTLKIFTTAAVLNKFGANFQFQTILLYTGSFDKNTGTITGDLIIKGSGDPSLQSAYFSKESITDKWAAILFEKGVRKINGAIIGDGSCFTRVVPGAWLYEDVSNYFGASACGLNFSDNKFSVFFKTQAAGSKATVVNTQPNYLSKQYKLNCEVIAKGSEDAAYAFGDPFSFDKQITGSIPANREKYEVELALPDPALLCAEQLFTSLTKKGIKCNSTNIQSNYQQNQNKQSTQLYTHLSPTLDKIVFFTNQNSDNQYCESLLRLLGEGDDIVGIQKIKEFSANSGVDTNEIYLKDGCGLARVNMTTPNAQTILLVTLSSDKMYSSFNNSLPLSGKNGSMSNIGKGSFIENNLRAKTGYMLRARAYSGYLTTKSGKALAFAVMMNNYNCTAKEAKQKMEKFMIALAEY